MRILNITILAICLIFIVMRCFPRKDTRMSLYEESDYIFSGTIIKQSASTMPNYINDERASIVKVEKVLKSSAGHENFEGMEITVLLNDEQISEQKEGFNAIFFTKTWLFGNSLAVLVKAVEKDTLEQVQNEIKQYQQHQEYNILKSRIKLADLIVYSKVEYIEDIKNNRQKFETEHDPEYKLAVIIAKDVLKGSVSLDTLKFYFASSDDIQWYRSPKFVAGREGIFLLKKATDISKEREYYTLLHPLDFQESSKLEAIKEILK